MATEAKRSWVWMAWAGAAVLAFMAALLPYFGGGGVKLTYVAAGAVMTLLAFGSARR
jgi:hypothetical protein